MDNQTETFSKKIELVNPDGTVSNVDLINILTIDGKNYLFYSNNEKVDGNIILKITRIVEEESGSFTGLGIESEEEFKKVIAGMKQIFKEHTVK